MKSVIERMIMVLGLYFIVLSCGKEPSSQGIAAIKAEFKNAEGQLIYLEDVNGSSAYAIDTLMVKNGKGMLTAKVQPGIYRIRAASHPGNNFALIYLDNDSQLDFAMDFEDPRNYTISGDKENVLLKKALLHQDELANQANQYQAALQATGDIYIRDSINNKFRELVETATRDVKAAIDESSSMDPNLTAYLLNLLDPNTQLAYINTQLQALSAKDPESKLIKRMVSHYSMDNSQAQPQEGGLSIGSVAPEIVQTSPGGVDIPLSSLRGKYVLIDFWASWCRPCRLENPNVVRTYNEYKDKGFEVYSVSLDKSKDRWEQAIKDDGLVWESHVSDLKAWSNEAARTYGVGSIPATFLIDPEGRIIARNLRGSALEQKLKEVLGDA